MPQRLGKAFAGVGLAALVWGCAGDPAPEPAGGDAEARAAQQPAKPAAQAPKELPIKAGSEAFAPMAKAPEPVDLDSVPGDGAIFPLEVTLVPRRGAPPIPYAMSADWYFYQAHPKADMRGGSKLVWDEKEARCTWERFIPSVWEFVVLGENVPKIRVNTGIWTQPPGGKLEIPLNSFEMKGQVLGPDGRGYSGSELTFKAQGLPVDPSVARQVRFISAYYKISADAQGRFTVPYMMPGTWMVSFTTGKKLPSGAWMTKRVRQVVRIKADQALTLEWKELEK
ncbi:MAG: peptidase associated/transthyretin-like domain-containing protein [Planctomycetota bacterium]|jgi:hypothetical protein